MVSVRIRVPVPLGSSSFGVAVDVLRDEAEEEHAYGRACSSQFVGDRGYHADGVERASLLCNVVTYVTGMGLVPRTSVPHTDVIKRRLCMTKVSLGLCLALPLLSACAATAPKPTVVAVDEECKAGRREMLQTRFVYFEGHSSALDERQKEVAQRFASVFIKNHGTVIIAYGHIDGAERRSSDQSLGLRRAEAVAAVFAEQGVRPRNILTKDEGFSHPFVPQKPGVSEAQNRFVMVRMVGVDESYESFISHCKAVIKKSCFGPIGDDQRQRCDAGLDVLAPAE